MKTKKSKYILIIATLFWSVAMILSCGNGTKPQVQPVKESKFPLGEASDFELIYTDSTRVKAILTSAKNIDFSNQPFPYTEFPEGLKVTFFNNQKQKTILTAQYGIYYLKTNVLELKTKVNLVTHEGKKLQTDQLFWHEKEDWVFTEKPFVFTDVQQKSITKGIGMDFDKSFTQLKAHKITGILPLKE